MAKLVMKIASLFSGCGGLDLGFTNVGFKMVYANDFDKMIGKTFLWKDENPKIKDEYLVKKDKLLPQKLIQ